MSIFFDDNFQKNMIQDGHIGMFRSNIKKNEHHNFTGNVLILSDRLLLLASELQAYMESSTSANIVGVISNINDINSYPIENIDYVIIVGYLEKDRNYQIVDIVRSKNENVKTIQWAMLDSYIKSISIKYNIPFQFDRIKPASEFINYLSEIKDLRDCDMDEMLV